MLLCICWSNTKVVFSIQLIIINARVSLGMIVLIILVLLINLAIVVLYMYAYVYVHSNVIFLGSLIVVLLVVI